MKATTQAQKRARRVATRAPRFTKEDRAFIRGQCSVLATFARHDHVGVIDLVHESGVTLVTAQLAEVDDYDVDALRKYWAQPAESSDE